MQLNFLTHPHKYNLFGLSSMLSDYGIESAGIKIGDKINDILNIEGPFVAQLSGDFALVYHVTDREVKYRIGNQNIRLPLEMFCDRWSGIVLLIETNLGSIEPSYRENLRRERLRHISKLLLSIAVAFLFVSGLYNNNVFGRIDLLLSFVINIMGACISFMLIQKQLKINSSYTDKICSLFKKAECNNVLESNASKFMDTFSWSEIGFSYFVSNLIIIAFLPSLFTYYVTINIFSLPFVIWSIWYQGWKLKQWCILCLLNQAALLLAFSVNFLFHNFQVPTVLLSDVVLVISIYLASLLTINLLLPNVSNKAKAEIIKQEINSLKSHDGVISTLLKDQPRYPSCKSHSSIFFGDPTGNILVTILSNPHCNPCAIMHAKVEKLLLADNENLCFQYIFSSFNQSLDISNRYLIAAYLNSNENDRSNIYTQWFSKMEKDKDGFFAQSSFDPYGSAINTEFEKHSSWKLDTKLEATPTVLINGYKLPPNYQIEDLRFVSELSL